MYRILIVEDDEVIAGEAARHLIHWGYEVRQVEQFEAVMEEFVRFSPQLVLMDIGLPFFNGYHWCSEIRKVSKVPVMFLSSMSENMNIVMAVNMGADDFIAKPFDLEILAAKIQALLRRAYSFQPETSLMEHNGLILNCADATASKDGVKISLTKNEYRILEILFENRGKVVNRDKIMKRLWDSDLFIDDNTLTVNVARLRKKLEEEGLPGFIRTKKGIGYLVE